MTTTGDIGVLHARCESLGPREAADILPALLSATDMVSMDLFLGLATLLIL